MSTGSGRQIWSVPYRIYFLFHNAFTCEYLLAVAEQSGPISTAFIAYSTMHSLVNISLSIPLPRPPNYTTQTQHNGRLQIHLYAPLVQQDYSLQKRYVCAVSLATASFWEVPATSLSTCFITNWIYLDSNFTGFFFLNNLFLI